MTLQNTLKGSSFRGNNLFPFPKASNMSLAYLSQGGNKATQSVMSNKTAFPPTQLVGSNRVGASPVATINSSQTPAYKRFTVAKLRAKREKGLCYYGDEKYNPQHKCKSACFLLVDHEEIEEILMEEEQNTMEEVEEKTEKLHALEVAPEISLNALAGQFHLSTIRVIGYCVGMRLRC